MTRRSTGLDNYSRPSPTADSRSKSRSTRPAPSWASGDPLVDELHEHARKTAPLPMTGAAPDWTDGKPAGAVHRAGLTYIMRAQGTTG